VRVIRKPCHFTERTGYPVGFCIHLGPGTNPPWMQTAALFFLLIFLCLLACFVPSAALKFYDNPAP
jgi:hypothetical protein